MLKFHDYYRVAFQDPLDLNPLVQQAHQQDEQALPSRCLDQRRRLLMSTWNFLSFSRSGSITATMGEEEIQNRRMTETSQDLLQNYQYHSIYLQALSSKFLKWQVVLSQLLLERSFGSLHVTTQV